MIKLLIAFLAPSIWGLLLSLPCWAVVLAGVLPWAILERLSLFGFIGHLRSLYSYFFFFEAVMFLGGCFVLAIRRRHIWKRRRSIAQWVWAIMLPSFAILFGLAMRGLSIEYPSDTFLYYYNNLFLSQLDQPRPLAELFTYSSTHNWYYATYYFLLNFQAGPTMAKATCIAAINTFILVIVSSSIVFRLTREWKLAWLSCLLLLIGFGNNTFHFFHQFALNGTLLGISLVLASATPGLLAMSEASEKQKLFFLSMFAGLQLFCGFFAYLAHSVSGFFVLNLLLAICLGFIFMSKDKRLRVLAILGIAMLFVFLSSLPWNSNVEAIYSYPDSFRIVHKTMLAGFRIIWFWPAMPNSIVEPAFIAAVLLGAISIAKISKKGLLFSSFTIFVLSILPFLVLAEWLLPIASNVVFKLISPDVAYRVAWTSLFWISIPVVAQELSKTTLFGYSMKRGVKGLVQGLLVVLAVPVNVGVSSNIFHSKIPHLLEPIRLKSMVDGSDMQPLVKSIAEFCAMGSMDSRANLLSDPMVGSVLKNSSCFPPLAGRDYNALEINAAENLLYPGLGESLSNSAGIRKWLESRDVGLIVLRSSYPNYTSEVALGSGHWQADLVSSYRSLALNRLDEKILSEAGFIRFKNVAGYEIYVKASIAP